MCETKEQAEAIARKHLEASCIGSGIDPLSRAIVPEFTEEHDIGWVCVYQGVRFEDGQPVYQMLIGGSQIFVRRKTGAATDLGSAHPATYYVDRIRRGLRV